MKIDLSKGCYSFQLSQDDLVYNLAADNVMEAREIYLRHITYMVNNAIDDGLMKLCRIEKEVKEEY